MEAIAAAQHPEAHSTAPHHKMIQAPTPVLGPWEGVVGSHLGLPISMFTLREPAEAPPPSS